MKKLIAAKIIATALFVTGCATQPTPEQLQAYANIAHQEALNALQDYKQIKPLIGP